LHQLPEGHIAQKRHRGKNQPLFNGSVPDVKRAVQDSVKLRIHGLHLCLQSVVLTEKDFIPFIAKITDHLKKNKRSKQTRSKTAPKNRGWKPLPHFHSGGSGILPRYSGIHFQDAKDAYFI
jgi:hypothetical protein